jgi:hypothetical protein
MRLASRAVQGGGRIHFHRSSTAHPRMLFGSSVIATGFATVFVGYALTKPKATAKAKSRACSDEDDSSDDSSDGAQEDADEEGGEDEPLPSKVKMGVVVHIPHSVFPEEKRPELGYWVGKTVYTSAAGGRLDVGILAQGEKEVFTRGP